MRQTQFVERGRGARRSVVRRRVAAATACLLASLATGRADDPPVAPRPAYVRPPQSASQSTQSGPIDVSMIHVDVPSTTVGPAWSALGPAPSVAGGAIVSPNNEVCGAIQAIAAHPTNASVLYVGAVNGGVWKTTNATATAPNWAPLTDAMGSLSIGALEFDPTDANHLTLVAGFARISSYGAVGGTLLGVIRTTDGGMTWSQLGGSFSSENLTSVAARGSVILAASDNQWSGGNGSGLFRSTNTGTSFTLISGGSGTGLPAGPVSDLVGDPGNTSRFFCAVRTAGIYRSTDSGATWTNVTASGMGITSNTTKIEMAVFDNGTTAAEYVGVITAGSLSSMWRSTNAGGSWTQMDTPTTHNGAQGDIHFSICADASSATTVYVGGDSIANAPFTGNLFRGNSALSAGSQFTSIVDGNASNTTPHADSRELVADANGDLIEGDDGGLYRRTSPTSSSGQWVSVVGNLACMESHHVAYDSIANVAMLGTQDNGTHVQSISSSVWTSVSAGDGGDVAIDSTSTPGQSIRYGSSQDLFGFYRMTYNASNTLLATVYPNLTVLGGGPAISTYFTTPIELNKIDPTRLIIGGANSPYESFDRGDTVTAINVNHGVNGDFTVGPIAYGGVSSGTANADVLWYGSGSSVRVRTTSGGSISATATAFPGGTVQDIVLDAADWHHAFVAGSAAVYETTNTGSTWTNITGNLTGVGSLHSLEFFKLNGTNCVACGTDLGAYCTLAGAFGTWFKLGSNGLPAAAIVTDLSYDDVDKVLVAATLGRGAFLLYLNNPPAVSLPSSGIAYTENDPATILDAAATVTDTESADFVGGSLTVDFIAGGAAEDRLAIVNQGGGAGQIGASGANVTFGGTTIGTFAGGGSGSTPLVVTFTTASATPAAAQALLRKITYQNVSDNPSTTARTVRVLVNDGDGGTSTAATKTVNVTAVNDPPVNTVPGALTTNEDFPIVFSAANGTSIAVTDPDAASLTVTITVVNGTATLATLGGLSFTSGDGVADAAMTFVGAPAAVNAALNGMTFTPPPDVGASSSLTITSSDGVASDTDVVSITVLSVNDPPTINLIADRTIDEDAPTQQVALTGIGSGAFNESDTMTITATSSNPSLIPDPQVTYTSPNSTGTLTFTPVPDGFGTAIIFVYVDDGQAQFHLTARSFVVTVNPVNDPPTLAPIADVAMDEDSPTRHVNLSGIGMGAANENQTLTITAVSDAPGIVPNPIVTYASPAATGQLAITPAANAFGTATITVQVDDHGGLNNVATRTFVVTVNPVNDAPTLAPLAAMTLDEDAPQQHVALSGIGTGAANEFDTLTVTATTSNPALVPNPTITYSSPDSTGVLTFTPAPDANGTAVIAVYVDDGQSQNHQVVRAFLLTVNGVNDPPTFVLAGDVAAAQDAGPQTIAGYASSIAAGPADEVAAGQTVDFVVSADHQELFLVQPTIDASGALSFTPRPDVSGVSTVVVRGHDDGGTARGGIDTSEPRTFRLAVTTYDEELGVYDGAVLPDDGAGDGAEKTGLLQLTLAKKGAFTGKLTLGAAHFAIKGTLDKGGVPHFGKNRATTTTLKRKGLPDLAFGFHVDVAWGTDRLTAFVTESGAPFAAVVADRALHPASPAGRYTVKFDVPDGRGLPDAAFPHGFGFGAITVKAGAAKFSGSLADGTKFSFSNQLSKDGALPLFLPLAGGKGSLVGEIRFHPAGGAADVDAAGLLWFRPADAKAKRYGAGWPDGIAVDLVGSVYVPPDPKAPTASLPGLTPVDADGNADLAFTGGGLPDTTKALNVSEKNKATVVVAGDKTTVTIDGKTGLFSGRLASATGGAPTPFQGVILQNQRSGAGFFLGATAGGAVTLTPAH